MKKRWAAISLAVAMALLCTGCFPTGVQVKGDISITDPAELKNLPDHYREQLSDRLLVNADIIVPEDATYHIYKAQLRKPDVETWVDLCYYAGDFTRYNEEEQGYFISYRALVDNVPVYDFNYTPPNQDIVSGSYLGLAYTNYGLDEVWTGGFYETTECVQEDVDLISLESALSSVQTYLEEMVDMGPILINKAELCYLPITNDVDGNDFTLQPTWVIDTYVFMQEVDWSKVQDLEDIKIEQDSIDVLAFSLS